MTGNKYSIVLQLPNNSDFLDYLKVLIFIADDRNTQPVEIDTICYLITVTIPSIPWNTDKAVRDISGR